MSDQPQHRTFLRAIRKCLTDALSHFQEAMDLLDEIGRASLGAAMTPFLGGYAMKDPEEIYRKALIEVDAGEKALLPLAKRFRNGSVNSSHFQDESALVLLRNIVDYDYGILVRKLAERKGRDGVWHRLNETSKQIDKVLEQVASE